MDWLILSALLWVALGLIGWRIVRRRRSRQSLCRNCQYDYLDVCRDPRRPHARECDIYLPIEDADEEEYREYSQEG